MAGLNMMDQADRHFANAVYFAARSFCGIRNSQWGFSRYEFNAIGDDKQAAAIFRRGDFRTAVARMWLKRDWMDRVHAHHLHELPDLDWYCDPLPGEKARYGCWANGKIEPIIEVNRCPVFVLDGDRPFFSDNAWAAPATWIVRGKAKKSGSSCGRTLMASRGRSSFGLSEARRRRPEKSSTNTLSGSVDIICVPGGLSRRSRWPRTWPSSSAMPTHWRRFRSSGLHDARA